MCSIEKAARAPLPASESDLFRWADQLREQSGCQIPAHDTGWVRIAENSSAPIGAVLGGELAV